MNKCQSISGAGTGPTDKGKEKDEGEDKEKKIRMVKDPVLEIAEFFEAMDKRRPIKPRVITSFRYRR